MDFISFPKIARWSREIIITEKLDGTNAQVLIQPATEDDRYRESRHGWPLIIDGLAIYAGSRSRPIAPDALTGVKGADNFGFASWVQQNSDELVKLGEGRHFGEWWGQGIQRGYGLKEKRFSLFNVRKWVPSAWPVDPDGMKRAPSCCGVVPILYRGNMSDSLVREAMDTLASNGSRAAPGYPNPEGIVIFHTQSGALFKKTFENDEKGKETA